MADMRLLSLVIFLSVLLLVLALFLALFGKSILLNHRLGQRLNRLGRVERPERPVKTPQRDEAPENTRRDSAPVPSAPVLPAHRRWLQLFQNVDLPLSPALLAAGFLPSAAVLYLVLMRLGALPEAFRLPVALLAPLGGLVAWISARAKKRRLLLEEQLPDAIELLVRALRVGHSFVPALASVARELPDPLGSELAKISDEAAYGRDIAEALKAFAERLNNQDLRFLAVAVTIQQQSGGNLAEILDGLAKVIRARFKLFRRVRAITAEAKWSGMFLSAFPLAAGLMMQVTKPEYYDAVRETEYFTPAVLIVLGLLAVNVLYMRKMVDIKV